MLNSKNIQIYTKDYFIKDADIYWAVVASVYKNKWIFVKLRDRKTWEMPWGKKHQNETIYTCAERELKEETGAKIYDIEHFWYSSFEDLEWNIYYVALYFAQIFELEDLSENSEIWKIDFCEEFPTELTYPDDVNTLFPFFVKFRKYMESWKDYEDEEKSLKELEKNRPNMTKTEQNQYSIKEICKQKAYLKTVEEMIDVEKDLETLMKN